MLMVKEEELYIYLEVHVDGLFNWNDIIYAKSKLSKSVAIMNRCYYLLSKNNLHILYCLLFLPYLTYSIEI